MLTYREKDNLIYKLHPVTSMAFVAIVFILSLLFSQPVYLLALMLAVGTVMLAAGNMGEWMVYLKFSIGMMVIIILINAVFSSNGSTVIYASPPLPFFGQLRISLESLAYGVGMSLRLLVIISIFCLYTYIVNPDKAMKVLGNGGGKSVLVITLCTRLFPLLVQDFHRISEVQRCRGVKLHSGTSWEKLKNYLPVFSIMLLSCLERSLQLAESMYARAYGSGKRSNYRQELWHPRDYIIILMLFIALITGIWSSLKGWSAYTYYPSLGKISLKEMLPAGFVAVSLMFPAILDWGWGLWPPLKSRI